ncbi:MAG TPA: NAD(P)/FAD-dependent oxidoreductase [Terriglobales bacterium]|nr:NAD(P)/FAD-dependent oxidoreductase [Terriglobales bacterium]
MEHAEVVVVGGGVAGLAALQTLRGAGCEAVLLEARARLGGRLWTRQPEGWPVAVELGAEFIHGAPPELRGLAAAEEGAGQDWSWAGGELRPAREFGNGAWELLGRMGAIRAPAPDRSFADFLAECDQARAAARAAALGYIEGFEAADPARISVYSLNREREAEAEGEKEGPWPRRPRGGYGPWVETLGAEGRVSLETEVGTIAWRPGAVTITARRGGEEEQWQARRAILTLPLSLLQRSLGEAPAVRFEPGLEAKRAALEALVMGGALRVTLRLREAFWEGLRDAEGRRLEGLRFLFGRSEATGHFATWWTMPGAAQITGWAAGRHAWALAGRAPELLRERALMDLGERLGVAAGAIEPLLLEAHLHDWQADEWALGAYSYAAVGGADAFGALAAPLEQTLYFAGEATDNTGQHATVQGALRSGRRAAGEALAGI